MRHRPYAVRHRRQSHIQMNRFLNIGQNVYSRKLVVVIHNTWHIVASSVERRHASEFIPGFVTFVGDMEL